jgi:hypothetical protein
MKPIDKICVSISYINRNTEQQFSLTALEKGYTQRYFQLMANYSLDLHLNKVTNVSTQLSLGNSSYLIFLIIYIYKKYLFLLSHSY